MNIYANGFSCFIKNDGTEVILTFLQESPALDEKGGIIGVHTEKVGSFVLSPDCAKTLGNHLTGIFQPPVAE